MINLDYVLKGKLRLELGFAFTVTSIPNNHEDNQDEHGHKYQDNRDLYNRHKEPNQRDELFQQRYD